jgi:hypothetical protein
MKTIEFEDALKDYLEEMKRTGWYTKVYKAFVEATRLHHAARRCDCGVVARGAAGGTTAPYWIFFPRRLCDPRQL